MFMTLATSLVVLFNCYATADILMKFLQQCFLLAHLSRRLIGELIVYEGIRRPSIRLSTFSNDICSEAVRPILFIFHI